MQGLPYSSSKVRAQRVSNVSRSDNLYSTLGVIMGRQNIAEDEGGFSGVLFPLFSQV